VTLCVRVHSQHACAHSDESHRIAVVSHRRRTRNISCQARHWYACVCARGDVSSNVPACIRSHWQVVHQRVSLPLVLHHRRRFRHAAHHRRARAAVRVEVCASDGVRVVDARVCVSVLLRRYCCLCWRLCGCRCTLSLHSCLEVRCVVRCALRVRVCDRDSLRLALIYDWERSSANTRWFPVCNDACMCVQLTHCLAAKRAVGQFAVVWCWPHCRQSAGTCDLGLCIIVMTHRP
jgi:hypothetical protein